MRRCRHDWAASIDRPNSVKRPRSRRLSSQAPPQADSTTALIAPRPVRGVAVAPSSSKRTARDLHALCGPDLLGRKDAAVRRQVHHEGEVRAAHPLAQQSSLSARERGRHRDSRRGGYAATAPGSARAAEHATTRRPSTVEPSHRWLVRHERGRHGDDRTEPGDVAFRPITSWCTASRFRRHSSRGRSGAKVSGRHCRERWTAFSSLSGFAWLPRLCRVCGASDARPSAPTYLAGF